MNTRVFPGTLAPRYQELQVGNSVKPATVFTKSTQWSWASSVGSIVAWPCSSR